MFSLTIGQSICICVNVITTAFSLYCYFNIALKNPINYKDHQIFPPGMFLDTRAEFGVCLAPGALPVGLMPRLWPAVLCPTTTRWPLNSSFFFPCQAFNEFPETRLKSLVLNEPSASTQERLKNKRRQLEMELNLAHRDRRPRFLFVPLAQHTAFGIDGRSQGNVFPAWVAGSWHRACVSGLLFIFPHGARESKRGHCWHSTLLE